MPLKMGPSRVNPAWLRVARSPPLKVQVGGTDSQKLCLRPPNLPPKMGPSRFEQAWLRVARSPPLKVQVGGTDSQIYNLYIYIRPSKTLLLSAQKA